MCGATASAQERPPPEWAVAFGREMQSAGRAYGEQAERDQDLIDACRVAEAVARLRTAVPEEEMGPAHHFVLGNMLFDLSPELAYEHHRLAYEGVPEMPLTILEWGVERHRRREHAEAAALYAAYTASIEALGAPADDPAADALLADCLLALDRPDEALEAWRRADPAQNHTRIEEAYFWVSGHVHPLSERARRLAAVRAGELDELEALIEVDLFWERDWWNGATNAEALAADMELARELLVDDPRRLAELDLFVTICERSVQDDLLEMMQRAVEEVHGEPQEGIGPDRDAVLSRMVDLGMLDEGARLPASSLVMFHLYRYLLQDAGVDAGRLLAPVEAALRERALGEAADGIALDVLAGLYERTGHEDLDLVERLGWTRDGSVKCLLGLLDRQDPPPALEDELLRAGLERRPLDAELALFEVEAADRAGADPVPALVRRVRAGLRRLESWHDVEPWFGELEAALAARSSDTHDASR